MPPKPAPKLTKKQLKELAALQQKKKQQQDKKRQQEEQEKAKQNQRLDEIESKKRAQEEQRRIQTEKSEYAAVLEERIRNEQKLVKELEQALQWENETTQYFRNYDVRGTNLSTFINIFREEEFKKPQKSLEICEQAELMVSRLQQQILTYRADGEYEKEKQALAEMRQIHTIEMQKLEQIMIQMANSAEDMQEKNNELARNKGEPNRRLEGRKLLEYIHHMSPNFKIGMFLNSTTTKTVNKFRPIEIREFGLNTEIPSKWINANTIVKFEWVNFEPPFDGGDEKEREKQGFLIVGGVYNLEFYELLMGSKKINNVTLKKLFRGRQILQKFKLQTSLIKEPFQLQYQLPPTVFLPTFDQSTLQFAQYDFSANKWTTLPYDTVQEYDPVEKKVVLRVARPEPIAYIQSRCLDYPYVAWELRTVKDDRVLLDIELARELKRKTEANVDANDDTPVQRLIVTFEMYQDLVKLSLANHYPQLADLCQGYRTPQSLLNQLSKRGIHLLPQNGDYLESHLTPKHPQTQTNAIRNIAYAVQSFYFRSLPNPTQEITIKLKENLDHQTIFLQDQQKDWKKIHWRNDRCWVSNRNIKQKHLNLQILLEQHEICDKECMERVTFDRKFLLRRTVMKMLGLTRVLSFTTGKEVRSRLRETIRERVLVK